MTQYGPVQKIEAECPNTLRWAYQSIAGVQWDAPNPQLLGAWSSGTHDGAIAQTIIAVHDGASPRQAIWGQYVELIARPGSSAEGTVHDEWALINQRGSCADISPHWPNNPGVFTGPRVGVGKPGSNGGEVSALGVYVNVEGTESSVARLGMVFGHNVVKLVNGLRRVINMAKDHALVWWDEWGRETSYITCTTTRQDNRVGIRLANGAINFVGPDGFDHFSFNCSTGAFYMGSGAVGPNGTIRIWVAGRPYLLKATPE